MYIFCLVKQPYPCFFTALFSCWYYVVPSPKQLFHSLCTSSFFCGQLFFKSYNFAFIFSSKYEYPSPRDIHSTLYFRCHGVSIASITIRTIDQASTKQLDDICHNILCATIMHLNFDAGGYWFADL